MCSICLSRNDVDEIALLAQFSLGECAVCVPHQKTLHLCELNHIILITREMVVSSAGARTCNSLGTQCDTWKLTFCAMGYG